MKVKARDVRAGDFLVTEDGEFEIKKVYTGIWTHLYDNIIGARRARFMRHPDETVRIHRPEPNVTITLSFTAEEAAALGGAWQLHSVVNNYDHARKKIMDALAVERDKRRADAFVTAAAPF